MPLVHQDNAYLVGYLDRLGYMIDRIVVLKDSRDTV